MKKIFLLVIFCFLILTSMGKVFGDYKIINNSSITVYYTTYTNFQLIFNGMQSTKDFDPSQLFQSNFFYEVGGIPESILTPATSVALQSEKLNCINPNATFSSKLNVNDLVIMLLIPTYTMATQYYMAIIYLPQYYDKNLTNPTFTFDTNGNITVTNSK